MKKRTLAMLLAVVMLIGLAACGNDEPATSETSKQPSASQDSGKPVEGQPAEPEFEGVKEIVIGIGYDIKSWEPWGNFNVARQNQAPIVYQTLTTDVVNLEENTMEHRYILAESAEAIGNNTYRIKIREGIVDTAGNPFTASDAVFSLTECKNHGGTAHTNIKEVKLVDEMTLDLTLIADTVGAFYDVCNSLNMVTQASYEASPDGMASEPIGTTPMVLKEYVAGASVTFVKADSYWNEAANESKDPDAGYCTMWDFSDIDVIRYECITDTAAMAMALETGQIDIARTIGIEDIRLFEANDDFGLFATPDSALGIAFNASDNSPFANINLRLAFAHIMDSEALLSLFDGHGEVAKAWSYKTFVDYQAEWADRDYFEYDMAKAKDYLAKWEQETGKKASDLQLRIMFQNEENPEALALSIQAAASVLTGNPTCVELVAYDRGTFTQAKKDATAYEMLIVDSQLVNRSHSGYEWGNLVYTAKLGYNCFQVEDEVLQEKLMDAILTSTTSDETVAAFQDYVDEQCYMKNLVYVDDFGAAASWIGNLGRAIGSKCCLNLGALEYDWNASGK